MSGLSVPIRGTLAKVWDYELGRALNRSAETIKAYRLGKRRWPIEATRARLNAERELAERLRSEASAIIQRVESEARLAGLVLAPRVCGNVAAVRLGGSTGETLRRPRRRADPTRDAAESAS